MPVSAIQARARETFSSQPIEERADRLRRQTNPGTPHAQTSGLVAYTDQTPVGWCAVEPRPNYDGLLRVFKVPWEGRNQDKNDVTVWAVTYLFVRAGYGDAASVKHWRPPQSSTPAFAVPAIEAQPFPPCQYRRGCRPRLAAILVPDAVALRRAVGTRLLPVRRRNTGSAAVRGR